MPYKTLIFMWFYDRSFYKFIFIKLIKLYNKCTFINLCHLSVLFSTNLNKKYNSIYLLLINELDLFF